jgi:hypothetical protein
MTAIARQRRMLQQVVGLVAVVPVAIGLYGILFGQSMTGDAVSISAESHFRYLSGLLFGIGLCFWSTVPGIEHKTGRFRLLTLIVVVGGLARLAGLGMTGLPRSSCWAGSSSNSSSRRSCAFGRRGSRTNTRRCSASPRCDRT